MYQGNPFFDAVVGGQLAVGLPVALLAGLISFLSPCVLPLVPGYLGYVGGLTTGATEIGARRRDRRRLVLGVVLFILGFYVTMVYGPIAAALVEMFPTNIRYTSMSLPYHIGNGWFGGFLPTTAFAIVAATGNIYSGLWYPIVVALGTVVLGFLLVKEGKDVDLNA